MNQRSILITRRIHLPSLFFNLEVVDQDGDITERMLVTYISYLIIITLTIGEEEEDRGSECTEETPVSIPLPLPPPSTHSFILDRHMYIFCHLSELSMEVPREELIRSNLILFFCPCILNELSYISRYTLICREK